MTTPSQNRHQLVQAALAADAAHLPVPEQWRVDGADMGLSWAYWLDVAIDSITDPHDPEGSMQQTKQGIAQAWADTLT